ncbi:transposase [Paenibacillus polymyxa]|uniref:transposase n=1 Tax=Paenibacillus polymyxa TaxID=1406 RepID=UPI00202572C8|nr:transposase [Paenibacillus polymyxa]URJ43682.1 transposase [Paenibacillus polymyxa]
MDEWELVGSTQKRMKHKLRMMETTDSQGNFLILLTNRFDLSCDEISEMYRSRWAIETFFKWMKQHKGQLNGKKNLAKPNLDKLSNLS